MYLCGNAGVYSELASSVYLRHSGLQHSFEGRRRVSGLALCVVLGLGMTVSGSESAQENLQNCKNRVTWARCRISPPSLFSPTRYFVYPPLPPPPSSSPPPPPSPPSPLSPSLKFDKSEMHNSSTCQVLVSIEIASTDSHKSQARITTSAIHT